MKLRVAVVVGLLAALTAAACSSSHSGNSAGSTGTLAPSSAECAANRAAGTIHYASPFGYDASPGIMDVYAAVQLGYFADLCLNVDFINVPFTESPYSLVSAGTAQLTSAGSAADVLASQSGGANLIGIATYADTSDYALLTRPDVTKLTQLEGKLLAYHTSLPVVLTEMLVKAGVDVTKVRTTNDTSYNPELLTQDKFDALQAYQSNEPLQLRAKGDKFTMWTPAQFGIDGTFNVMESNRDFLSAHRGAVADFLRAQFHAFEYCNANLATCVGYLAKAQGSTFQASFAEAEWKFESALVASHHLPGAGVGVETIAEWMPEAGAVVQYKRVTAAPDLTTAEDTTVAASVYHGTTLIWP